MAGYGYNYTEKKCSTALQQKCSLSAWLVTITLKEVSALFMTGYNYTKRSFTLFMAGYNYTVTKSSLQTGKRSVELH